MNQVSTGEQQLSVLIVEDEPDLVSSVRRILCLDGFLVESAGAIGEMLGREDLSSFFAILLDRKLPDGMSDQALPRLCELAPNTKIIIVTGYADLDSSIAALRHGAEDYLIKPIDPDDLRKRLARLADLRVKEEALRRERDLVDSILRTAQSIVLVLDAEGRIVRFNPYLEELSGRRLDEVAGQSWFETFIPAEDRAKIERLFRKCLGGEDVRGHINLIVLSNGTLREIVWNNACLYDSTGNRLGLVCSGQDLTELKELHLKLVQSERLAAIGEAMAGLSHESRNALQRCQASLDLLEGHLPSSLGDQELLKGIRRSLDELHRLYEEVRQYAAPVQLERTLHSLPKIVRTAWEELIPARNQRQAQLSEYPNGDDLRCRVDAFQLGKVFRNLFENSLAACRDPVELTVRYQALCENGSSSIEIRVSDNGPGLNAEQQRRVFDSFYTTKNKGTGLGMAIARRIVESHGGQILVNPNCGTGAEFVITVPKELT